MDKLTLVEFHLHTDEFSPEATSIIGGGTSGEDEDDIEELDEGRRGPWGLLALLAVLGVALAARKLRGEEEYDE